MSDDLHSDCTGLLLALGIVLSEPLTEANRKHFAKRCLEEAEKHCPGIVPAPYRGVLGAG